MIMVIVLLLSVVLLVFLSRGATAKKIGLLGPSIPGIALAMVGLLLPWVQFGPSDSLNQNAIWLSNQAKWLDQLRDQEPFASLLEKIQTPTSADILSVFDSAEEKTLLTAYHETGFVTGWQEALFIRAHDPTLTLSIFVGSLVCCVLAIANGFRLASGKNGEQIFFYILQGLLGILLVYVLMHIAVMDTFATHNNFRIRILLSMMEARSGVGPYIMISGWALTAMSALYDSDPDSESDTTQTFDPYEERSSYA